MSYTDRIERNKRQQLQKLYRRDKNINKHIRIANATKGHEKKVHLARVQKLEDKYSKLK